VKPLLAIASPTANGLGWGMKHDWTTLKGLIPKDTPCHTQTAYAFEFLSALYDVTGNQQYIDYLHQIAEHTANDFREWQKDDRLASSYSPIDDRRVVNANSYRALILLEAGRRLGQRRYTDKGLATVRYVISMQKPNGSWPYSEDETFVDHYHTCFVLKNLRKVRVLAVGLENYIDRAVEAGLIFYFSRLFSSDGYPKPFAVKPRLVLHKYDSYDLAESIGLLALMRMEPERLLRLVEFARDKFQTKEGWFVFRQYPMFPVKGIPYLRYANSAMFSSLTLVASLSSKGANPVQNR
jgi:hypothetical protein